MPSDLPSDGRHFGGEDKGVRDATDQEGKEAEPGGSKAAGSAGAVGSRLGEAADASNRGGGWARSGMATAKGSAAPPRAAKRALRRD